MDKEISLSKFLSRYCYLKGETLKKVTHQEVKELFPEFKRSSFKEINEHPELLVTGKVILVNDGKKTIPYYSLPIEEDKDYTELMREEVKKLEINDKHYDYSSLSIYELRLLLRHRFNSLRNQCCARNELKSRGVVLSKKYNRCKMKRDKEDY